MLYLVMFVGLSAYSMGRVDRERAQPPTTYTGSPLADGARALAAAERRRAVEPVG